MSDSSGASSGIGLPGLLTVLFVYLKLTGHVAWSWWWVTAPCWMAAIVVVLAIVLVAIADSGSGTRRR